MFEKRFSKINTASARPKGENMIKLATMSSVCPDWTLDEVVAGMKRHSYQGFEPRNYYYILVLQIRSYDELELNEEASFQLNLPLLLNFTTQTFIKQNGIQ